MAVIDGEELTFKCIECGHKFTRLIGYGPIYPTPWLRKKILKENPSVCPHCHSQNVKRLTMLGKMIDMLNR